MILKILLVSLLIFELKVQAAVSILPKQEKPAKYADQEGCYVPDLERVLPYEVPFSPQDGKTCIQYNCMRDDTTSIFTCGALEVRPPCRKIPGNKYRPYPDCCDYGRCPKVAEPVYFSGPVET